MKAKIHISNLGNSLALPIPDYIVKLLNLKANDSVICSIENGKMVIEPVNNKISKYTLDELLAGEIEPSEEIYWGKPDNPSLKADPKLHQIVQSAKNERRRDQ